MPNLLRHFTIAAGLVAVATTLAGCPGLGADESTGTLSSVPDEPNFDEHIGPIMDRYCNACHGEVALQGAPNSFRLDVCESVGEPGAQAYAQQIVETTLDSPSDPMPPAGFFPGNVSSIEAETLRLWLSLGAPCRPGDDGPPSFHPDNYADGDVHGPSAMFRTNIARDDRLPLVRDCNDATCHGNDLTGSPMECDTCTTGCVSCHEAEQPTRPRGWWVNDCTGCHGDKSAWPSEIATDWLPVPNGRFIDGSVGTDSSAGSWDIHMTHAVATEKHAAYECEMCHVVPTAIYDPGHMFGDATPGLPDVVFDSVNSEGKAFRDGYSDTTTRCQNLWCHDNGRRQMGEVYSDDEPLSCTGCHQSQSSTSWTDMTPNHDVHMRLTGARCATCHANVVTPGVAGQDPPILDIARHANGFPIDVDLSPDLDEPIKKSTADGSVSCAGTCHLGDVVYDHRKEEAW